LRATRDVIYPNALVAQCTSAGASRPYRRRSSQKITPAPVVPATVPRVKLTLPIFIAFSAATAEFSSRLGGLASRAAAAGLARYASSAGSTCHRPNRPEE